MTCYFDIDLYKAWRENRFKAIIQHYGRDYFRGKTMLEVGAGNGDFGQMFVELGAYVTSFEGRDQNFQELKDKYPDRQSFLVDLDHEQINWPYDIILNVGLLYHLINFEDHLANCMCWCDEMILETEVIDLSQEGYWKEREDVTNQGAGLHSFGTKATISYIERLLTEGSFEWSRPQDPGVMNTPPWIYDWIPENKGLIPGVGFRAMWFCKKKEIEIIP